MKSKIEIYKEEEWEIQKDDNKITTKIKKAHNKALKRILKIK